MSNDFEESSSEKNEKPASNASSDTEKPQETKKSRKYVFECTKCGLCCEKRSFVPVNFLDIQSWMTKGIINTILPFLEVQFISFEGSEKNAFPSLFLTAVKDDQKEETSVPCPMYDIENKICKIYWTMPSDCNAFPLGYDGKNYKLKDKTCEGLGKGMMTKEKLLVDRDKAKTDFEAKIQSNFVFPILYNTVVKSMMQQQQKMMDNLTDDQKAKLQDILGKKEEKA